MVNLPDFPPSGENFLLPGDDTPAPGIPPLPDHEQMQLRILGHMRAQLVETRHRSPLPSPYQCLEPHQRFVTHLGIVMLTAQSLLIRPDHTAGCGVPPAGVTRQITDDEARRV